MGIQRNITSEEIEKIDNISVADSQKLGFIDVTQNVNLDTLETDVTNNTNAISNIPNFGLGSGKVLEATSQANGNLINAATSKTTPIDADQVGLMDSAAGNILKKLSWANIKATLKTYFDTLYNLTTTFTSTDQTITSGGLLTIAHGLGVVPKSIQVFLVCQVAEQGYLIGDIVQMNVSGSGNDRGYTSVVNSTNVRIRFSDQANAFRILNFTDGMRVNATNARWKLRIIATTL